jgi:hypothetical protein
MSGVFKIKSLSSKKRQPFKKPISTMSWARRSPPRPYPSIDQIPLFSIPLL